MESDSPSISRVRRLRVLAGAVARRVWLRVIGLFTPLRATAREEALGMDIVAHGEEAYATGEGAILVDADVGRERELVG